MTEKELLELKPDKPNYKMFDAMISRFDSVCKPIDGLGDLERVIASIGAAKREEMPNLKKKALVIMCADNGVVEEGVSQTDESVTSKVAYLMGQKRSVVGVMLDDYDADTFVYDIGMKSDETFDGVINKKVANGTKNMVKEAAMSTDECLRAIEAGIDIVKGLADKYSILATGEMGIGNTTTSTALICALLNERSDRIVGKGAGLTKERLDKKVEVINRSIARAIAETGDVSDERKRALEMLHQLGGFDIAAMAGVFIGGAICHVPIVIDGLISVAAALAASMIVPGCEEYMLASHTGKERGTALALQALDLKAVINADLALGEGTGAVMLFPLIDMAYSVYEKGPFFTDAGMDAYERNPDDND